MMILSLIIHSINQVSKEKIKNFNKKQLRFLLAANTTIFSLQGPLPVCPYLQQQCRRFLLGTYNTLIHPKVH